MKAKEIDLKYRVLWPYKYFKAPTTFDEVEKMSIPKNHLVSTGLFKEQVKVSFLGDMMGMGNKKLKLGDLVQTRIQKSDYLVFNLEAVIADKNDIILSKQYTSLDSFKYLMDQLDPSKVIIGIANNHLSDYGEEGIESTLRAINEVGAKVIGTNESPLIKLSDDLCLVASTMWHSKNDLKVNRFDTNTQYDFDTIQFLHWGTEFSKHADEQQLEILKSLKDRSISIIGHHSHCPQPIIQNEGHITAFSLGNMGTSFQSQKINHGMMVDMVFGKCDKWKVIHSAWDFVFMSFKNDVITLQRRVS